jgi:hypothetical protein
MSSDLNPAVFVSSDRTIRSAAVGNVLLNLYYEANASALAELYEHQEAEAKKHENIVVLSVVHGTALEFDPGGRKTADRLVEDFEQKTLANATIVLAKGIRAAIARSAIAAIFLAKPVSHPRKVFSSVEDASEWVLKLAPELAPHRAGWTEIAQKSAEWKPGDG